MIYRVTIKVKNDENKFKIQLQRNDKKYQKRREIRNLFELLSTTTTDIIFRFMNYLRRCERGQFDLSILNEIEQIVTYVNNCLADVSNTYSSRAIQFTNEISFVR
jgi:hypothetical protein